LKPDINDWTVTDLGGTTRDFGATFANNNAALLDSVKSTVPMDGGGTMGAAAGYGSMAMTTKAQPLSRFSPELLIQLHALNEKRQNNNLQSGTVTIEEMGEAKDQPKPETDKKDGEDKDNKRP